jgi:hypothetical protein
MRAMPDRRIPLLLLLLLVLVCGCAGLPGACDDWENGNQLVNASFEMDRAGWGFRDSSPAWTGFSVSDDVARSGRRSAHVRVEQRAGVPTRKALISGVVQEPRPPRFPERIGGWYRVEAFEKSDEATDLYVQAVVIVWNDPRTPEIVDPEHPAKRLTNYQLRYYLAGITEPPFLLSNARVHFVEKRERPEMGKWVHFEMPVRADFEKLWGTVPEGYDRIRVLFEVRWDNMPEGGTAVADVNFDDLYFDFEKPAAEAP